MLKIRNANLKDCKKCAKISRIRELKVGDGYITEKYFGSFVDKDRMFFVAEDNGKIIGYILGELMKGNVAYLGLLTVAERYRQKGIGKKLVEAFRKRCDEKKLSYLVLLAPVFNKKTLEFYKKIGFKPSKTYIQFFEKRK